MSPVERHTIFLTLAGSQAHGTARDGSDLDLRGVCHEIDVYRRHSDAFGYVFFVMRRDDRR